MALLFCFIPGSRIPVTHQRSSCAHSPNSAEMSRQGHRSDGGTIRGFVSCFLSSTLQLNKESRWEMGPCQNSITNESKSSEAPSTWAAQLVCPESHSRLSPPSGYILCHRLKPSTMLLEFLNKSIFFFLISYLFNYHLSSSVARMGSIKSQEDKRCYQEAQNKPSAPNMASSGMSVSMPPTMWESPLWLMQSL